MKHQIRAVLFDLDGVLVFTDKYHYQAWKKLADEEGWDFNEEVNEGCRGVPRMASLQVLLDHNNVQLDQEKKIELAERKNGYYKKLLENINKDDLYPGAIQLLESLKKEGVKMAVCSSSKNAMPVLRSLEMVDYFQAIITGNDIKNAKPDPEIFLKASKALNIHPFHCLVFEDAYSGIQAAAAAGMKNIGVGSRKQLPNALDWIQDYANIDLQALLDCGRCSTVTPELWHVSEEEPHPVRQQYWETIFALTNGTLGWRGSHEEAVSDNNLSYGAVYYNGFYGYEPYQHIWPMKGFAKGLHAMLRVCDLAPLRIKCEGEFFSPFESRVESFKRSLDMKKGILERKVLWTTSSGKKITILSRRLVCMRQKHCLAAFYTISTDQDNLELEIESLAHFDLKTQTLKDAQLNTECLQQEGEKALFKINSLYGPDCIFMALGHKSNLDGSSNAKSEFKNKSYQHSYKIKLGKGHNFTLEKMAVLYAESDAQDASRKAEAELETCLQQGYSALEDAQSDYWQKYWEEAGLVIKGNTADQQALRFSQFQLQQSLPDDGKKGIGANGVTGDKYCGHIFWDSEMYMLPHFLYHDPGQVKPLLMYRYLILDKARERAAQLGHRGACYSWNSISGEECAVVFEASTAEYHLQCAIAFAIYRYLDASSDTDFLYNYGAEILFSTARFLADLGEYVPEKDNKFCFNIVCGPDEYGCGVNNNCYTNMMAAFHLDYAAKVYEEMKEQAPDKLRVLRQNLELTVEEKEAWQKAADNIYIPFDEKLGIHKQDDSFLELAPVDMEKMPRNRDIRADYHPLNLWRLQVIKQADVVLLMFVLNDKFDAQVKKRNYLFYEPKTVHGSSLSAGMHSVLASEIGLYEDAYFYFKESAFMDLHDFKNNCSGGVHSACLGATWMAVVNGFAGMRDDSRGLIFEPVLPDAWEGLSFQLHYKGRRLMMEINREKINIKLLEGEELSLKVYGKAIKLDKANKELSIAYLDGNEA